MRICYKIDFTSAAIGQQTAEFNFSLNEFNDFCFARAFGPAWHWVAAKLLSPWFSFTAENILFYTEKDFINKGSCGVKLGGGEPVWHKMIDFLGALAVLMSDIGGTLVEMEFLVSKSGHRFDIETLSELKKILIMV